MKTELPDKYEISIECFPRDSKTVLQNNEVKITIDADNIQTVTGQVGPGFTKSATLSIPNLVNLPTITKGTFSGLAISLYCPKVEVIPTLEVEVEIYLREKIVERRSFRRSNRSHLLFIPSELLFEDINVLNIVVKIDKNIELRGNDKIIDDLIFYTRIFYYSKERLFDVMARDSIWIFSTARSGSTWLANDILCWNNRGRPVDESGVGRLFAPLDTTAERYYDLAHRQEYIPSGLAYEIREKPRKTRIPPFERIFIYSEEENKIWSRQNFPLYLGLLRDVALQHAINEWGFLGYQYLVFKMPNDSHAADLIMRAFPESFMIFLMRDGRDVMKSRFSPFASKRLATTTEAELRSYAIAFYSHFWNFQVDIVKTAFDAHNESRRLFLRYEDLRKNPRVHIEHMFRCLNRAISEDELARLIQGVTLENIPSDQKGPDKPRQTGEIGKFTDVFTTDEIDLMNRIMGPNLRQFGYVSE